MNNQPVYRKNQIQTLILLLKVLELKSHEDNFFELVLFLARYSFLFENPQDSVNSCTSEVPQIYTEQAFSDWSMKFVDPDGREQSLAQKLFAKGLNFAVTHSDKAAAFIQDHTNVTVTRNVYEGEKIQQDKTIYYQDNISVEVCGIPLNNVQCQSTPDQPDLPGRDTIPNGTTGKADVGVSGATKDYIKDTLLFDDKGDFLHIKKPGTIRPGSWGCTIPKKDADVKETMDILRKDLGIENGKAKVNYSFDNSSEYRQNHRKENQQ